MASDTTPKRHLELPTIEQREHAIALLNSWQNCSDEEAREQKETLEFLMKALDEDRPSFRKLFP